MLTISKFNYLLEQTRKLDNADRIVNRSAINANVSTMKRLYESLNSRTHRLKVYSKLIPFLEEDEEVMHPNCKRIRLVKKEIKLNVSRSYRAIDNRVSANTRECLKVEKKIAKMEKIYKPLCTFYNANEGKVLEEGVIYDFLGPAKEYIAKKYSKLLQKQGNLYAMRLVLESRLEKLDGIHKEKPKKLAFI